MQCGKLDFLWFYGLWNSEWMFDNHGEVYVPRNLYVPKNICTFSNYQDTTVCVWQHDWPSKWCFIEMVVLDVIFHHTNANIKC